MKKAWKKPKLISLYRARPEEAVLTNCKSSLGGGPSGTGCIGYTAPDCAVISAS